MPLDQIDVDQMEVVSAQAEKDMTFLEHLEELRWHIVRSLVAIVLIGIGVFVAKDFVFNEIVLAPKYDDFWSYQLVCKASAAVGLGDQLCFTAPDFDIIATKFGERFIVHIKVAFILGLVLAFPYVFWEFWRFVEPGLYENERKAARGTVFVCSLLFLTGVLFGYFIISPFAVSFLAGYEIADVKSTTSLSSFVNYMTMFTLPAGLVFELPVVVYFLSKVGLIGPEAMRKYRRHAIIVILVLASMITPPDVVTQFLISIPLVILYEISIVISARVSRRRELELAG